MEFANSTAAGAHVGAGKEEGRPEAVLASLHDDRPAAAARSAALKRAGSPVRQRASPTRAGSPSSTPTARRRADAMRDFARNGPAQTQKNQGSGTASGRKNESPQSAETADGRDRSFSRSDTTPLHKPTVFTVAREEWQAKRCRGVLRYRRRLALAWRCSRKWQNRVIARATGTTQAGSESLRQSRKAAGLVRAVPVRQTPHASDLGQRHAQRQACLLRLQSASARRRRRAGRAISPPPSTPERVAVGAAREVHRRRRLSSSSSFVVAAAAPLTAVGRGVVAAARPRSPPRARRPRPSRRP